MNIKCLVTNLIWDTEVDGKIHKVKLPKKMEVAITVDSEQLKKARKGDVCAIEEINYAAMDKTSDITGWCILNCRVFLPPA